MDLRKKLILEVEGFGGQERFNQEIDTLVLSVPEAMADLLKDIKTWFTLAFRLEFSAEDDLIEFKDKLEEDLVALEALAETRKAPVLDLVVKMQKMILNHFQGLARMGIFSPIFLLLLGPFTESCLPWVLDYIQALAV